MESSQQQEGAGLEHLTSHPPASPVLNFHEANFIAFPNQRQSNIYGLCSLRINDCNKLLVATLRGQIFSLEFHKTPFRPPLFNPINFSYIPGKNGVSQNEVSKKMWIWDNFPTILCTITHYDKNTYGFSSYLGFYGNRYCGYYCIMWLFGPLAIIQHVRMYYKCTCSFLRSCVLYQVMQRWSP